MQGATTLRRQASAASVCSIPVPRLSFPISRKRDVTSGSRKTTAARTGGTMSAAAPAIASDLSATKPAMLNGNPLSERWAPMTSALDNKRRRHADSVINREPSSSWGIRPVVHGHRRQGLQYSRFAVVAKLEFTETAARERRRHRRGQHASGERRAQRLSPGVAANRLLRR